MALTVVTNAISGILFLASAFFFYRYGQEFFIDDAPLAWKLISAGFVLTAVSFFTKVVIEQYVQIELSMIFPTLLLLSSIIILAGIGKGFIDARGGEY